MWEVFLWKGKFRQIIPVRIPSLFQLFVTAVNTQVINFPGTAKIFLKKLNFILHS